MSGIAKWKAEILSELEALDKELSMHESKRKELSERLEKLRKLLFFPNYRDFLSADIELYSNQQQELRKYEDSPEYQNKVNRRNYLKFLLEMLNE